MSDLALKMPTSEELGVKGFGPGEPPPYYDRPPEYPEYIWEKDVMVPMRDGVRICADVYRPRAEGKFPAILAIAPHNKDLQSPAVSKAVTPQPAWSKQWYGVIEGGDTRFLTSRGYAHIVANPRGIGKSEDGGEVFDICVGGRYDSYDLIEWIAEQPWCDGNVGMIGISAFAGNQIHAASMQPPHLKAIFPYDTNAVYSNQLFGYRSFYQGGVPHLMLYFLDPIGVIHQVKGRPGELPPELEKQWQEAMQNPDYLAYPNLYNILTQRGQVHPALFYLLLHPYDTLEAIAYAEEEKLAKIKIPFYTGSGMANYTYKMHIQGAQDLFTHADAPHKKMLLTGPAMADRPWHSMHGEILRWYDYWLKGIDTGVLDEPKVKYWVMGENKWRAGEDWPLPETVWTKYYLNTWERLRAEPFRPHSLDSCDEPDAFVQMSPTLTNRVERLRYLSDPLPEDTLVVGPVVLKLFASLDQDDTAWIVILKDVGPDVSVQTAREGETERPAVPERELTRGWLKASLRATDPERSKPWKPFHWLTKEKEEKIVPGEIVEYDIEIIATSNMFKQGHRICLEITCADQTTGVAGLTNVEYIANHIANTRTTLHKIYRSEKYPSHLLLPVIPQKP
ncbi:MAG: CocE/NonD family hydrolase [Gracilibacteraceae bacterium]|jgi:putative CocE/NonD family hydrolase|nr:CocE/NonD family hydrolase [Gracilibacteraceae bacterium]